MINATISNKFKEYGLDESTLTSCPSNAKDKKRLVYTCKCDAQTEVDKSWRIFMERPLCDICMPKKKTGKKCPEFDKFIKMIEDENYEILDKNLDTNGYINTQSKIKVRDTSGNEYFTTYNRWQSGHRSKYLANQNLKLSIDEVRHRVENVGFTWLEGTVYQTEHIPFMVECHCGNEFTVALNNIRENRIGCSSCFIYNRKYPWSYIEGFSDKYGTTLISTKETYKGRDTIIEIICACGEHMVKNVRAFMKSPMCNICSGYKRSTTNLDRYGNFNFLASDLGKNMTKQYYLDNHGVDHNMKVKNIQETAQKTCLKNFGVKCILSTEDVRKKAIDAHICKWGAPPGCVEAIREKMKATNLEKLGVDYPLKSKKVQSLIKSNNLEKYGNEVFIQSEAGKQMMIQLYGDESFMRSDLGRQFMIQKYGNVMYVLSDEGKQLMIDKYGFPYAMQCPELFEKAMKSGKRRKPYTFPSGRIVELQGYEGVCMDYILRTHDVSEDEIVTELKLVPHVMYDLQGESKSRRYFMDAYLNKREIGIEVKSPWTYHSEPEKNKAKWIAASKICKHGFFVFVFNAKKALVSEEFFKDGQLIKSSPLLHDQPAFKSLF